MPGSTTRLVLRGEREGSAAYLVVADSTPGETVRELIDAVLTGEVFGDGHEFSVTVETLTVPRHEPVAPVNIALALGCLDRAMELLQENVDVRPGTIIPAADAILEARVHLGEPDERLRPGG